MRQRKISEQFQLFWPELPGWDSTWSFYHVSNCKSCQECLLLSAWARLSLQWGLVYKETC